MTYVSIAMSTYNGERYLNEQLESLANQTHLPIELVIGDDGSSDKTLDIIEDFRKHSPFPIYVHQNQNNLGYGRNFLATAKRCRGDWVAFCDQDDVWLPSKLANFVKAIEDMPNSCMVLQNALLCDEALKSSARKFPYKLNSGVYESNRQYGFWVWLGFLQTVRRDVFCLWDHGFLPRNYFPHYPEVSHDKWTCLIANALGGIIVLDEPVALYRRHESAFTGNYDQQSVIKRAAKSRCVSSEHYNFLAKVADDYGNYMQSLAKRSDIVDWISAFDKNSSYFYRLAQTQRLRYHLYTSCSFFNRLRIYFKILCSGGYIGPSFYAMGVKSAVKDLIRAIAGSLL